MMHITRALPEPRDPSDLHRQHKMKTKVAGAGCLEELDSRGARAGWGLNLGSIFFVSFGGL